MAETRSVSVIIPHYSDLRRLNLCLASLSRQVGAPPALELIVADNGSPEGQEAVREVVGGRATLIEVAQRGAGPARNGGVAASSGEVLAFTDSDCIPSPGWLAAGLSLLTAQTLVGGRMDVLAASPDRPTPTEAFEIVFAFDNARYVRSRNFTVTANLFCSRTDFDRVGGFRMGVSEDMDWCRRARDAGLSLIYAPDAAVGHPARQNWTELRSKWRRITRETYALRSRSALSQVAWGSRCLLLPLSAVAHTPKALFSRRLQRWRDRFGAVVILHRLRWWRMVDGLGLLLRSETAL